MARPSRPDKPFTRGRIVSVLRWGAESLWIVLMKNRTEAVMVPVEKKLPTKGHRVLVVCKGFRCLGCLNGKGVWRDDAKPQELTQVIGWMEILP
jgi:hypothetical protein